MKSDLTVSGNTVYYFRTLVTCQVSYLRHNIEEVGHDLRSRDFTR